MLQGSVMGFKPGQSGNPKGKPKGAISKLDKAQRAKALDGLTPLEYMLSILRDETKDEAVRMAAAKDAAPYVHARLASLDASLSGKVGLEVKRTPATSEDRAKALAALLAKPKSDG
jgi:hypothetical protein